VVTGNVLLQFVFLFGAGVVSADAWGWRGLLAMPHGVLEFAGYTMPLGLFLARPPSTHRTFWAAVWVNGFLSLVFAAIIETFLTPAIQAALHLPVKKRETLHLAVSNMFSDLILSLARRYILIW